MVDKKKKDEPAGDQQVDVKEKPAEGQQPQPGQEVAIYDPGTDAGAGLEDVSRDEIAIPFIYVLDPKSPQCAPVSAGGIAGAKGGMLYNTGTNEVYDGEKGIPFIPVHRDHNFGEWLPRNQDGSGGGFVTIRAADDPLVLKLRESHGKFGKLPTADGHELVEAYYLYGLIVTEFGASAALIPFKSTAIRTYQTFMNRVSGIRYPDPRTPGKELQPAMWAHRWMLGTQYKPAKKQGQSGWYIPRLWLPEEPPIKSRLKTIDPLYVQGKELYNSIKSGRAKAAKEMAREPGEDEEIPM